VSKLGLAINSLVFGGFQPIDVVSDIKQFQDKKRRGNIDIWWLYDDGGMPVMMAHILQSRQQFCECTLRVFTLGSDKLNQNLGMFSMFSKNIEAKIESKHMEDCLKTFRISTTNVTVVPNVSRVAEAAMWSKLREAVGQLPRGEVTEEDIKAEYTFVNKHLRINELLQEHSSDAQMILLTLPQQKVGSTNPALYLASIDVMTRDLPPVLMVGGNDISVLTSHT